MQGKQEGCQWAGPTAASSSPSGAAVIGAVSGENGENECWGGRGERRGRQVPQVAPAPSKAPLSPSLEQRAGKPQNNNSEVLFPTDLLKQKQNLMSTREYFHINGKMALRSVMAVM